MKQLMIAVGLTATFAFCASAQDAQKQNDPNYKQGTTGQKSGTPQKSETKQPTQGGTPQAQTKSAPVQPAPAKTPPAQVTPSKTTQAPSPSSVPAPPQKTIVFQPMPTITYRKAHGYSERRHAFCQEKAWQLHQYERHAAADGYISRSERATIRSLKDELNDRCDGFRWRD